MSVLAKNGRSWLSALAGIVLSLSACGEDSSAPGSSGSGADAGVGGAEGTPPDADAGDGAQGGAASPAGVAGSAAVMAGAGEGGQSAGQVGGGASSGDRGAGFAGDGAVTAGGAPACEGAGCPSCELGLPGRPTLPAVAVDQYASAIAAADLNADGQPDAVVVNGRSNGLHVFLNTGGGIFSPGVDYTAGAEPSSVAIGDLDGDGA
ncbi:MAG TPA: VCBS repeat-containing protein, partial [Polyangiaceae bacterium]|nr:VCBS repeat-containing protein [Polyangiaceae bacterium]